MSRLQQGLSKLNSMNGNSNVRGLSAVGASTAGTKNFEEMGGKIVAAETISADDDNFNAAITKVKPSNPEVVYFGGEYPQGGPLSQQMKAAGLNVPLMGGDGIFDPTFIELATKSSEGDLATSVGAPVDSSEAGKKFLADYEAAGFAEPSARQSPNERSWTARSSGGSSQMADS